MSFQRTLLTIPRDEHSVSQTKVTEELHECEEKGARKNSWEVATKKRSLKVHALPVLIVVLIILLFVSAYVLYEILTDKQDSDGKTVASNDFKSKISHPGCGTSKCKGLACTNRVRRLVGAIKAPKNDWPWMAEVLIDNLHSCGGVLINRLYVMTAAHCLNLASKPVRTGRITVNLGTYDRILPETSKQSFDACKYIIHENYDSYTLSNDIALIKLNKKCDFTDHVWPVCLPKYGKSMENSSGFMLGWGKEKPSGYFSPTLKQVHVPVAPITKCSAQNNKIFTELKINAASHMCVGYGNQRLQYACDGDSGGPFLQKSGKEWLVNGLISWVDPTCNSSIQNTYTVLTKVSHYENWIANNMDMSI